MAMKENMGRPQPVPPVTTPRVLFSLLLALQNNWLQHGEIDVEYIRRYGLCRPKGHKLLDERCHDKFPHVCKTKRTCSTRLLDGQHMPKRGLVDAAATGQAAQGFVVDQMVGSEQQQREPGGGKERHQALSKRGGRQRRKQHRHKKRGSRRQYKKRQHKKMLVLHHRHSAHDVIGPNTGEHTNCNPGLGMNAQSHISTITPAVDIEILSP
jgi:hypothetical protein